VIPTYNTCSNNNKGFNRLRLRYVGASSSRVRLAMLYLIFEAVGYGEIRNNGNGGIQLDTAIIAARYVRILDTAGSWIQWDDTA